MVLTDLQKDFLFGSLLGDGNLQSFSGGKTWRYRAIQQSKHKEYLFHKYDILKPLCGPDTLPQESQVEDERIGNVSKRWTFNTLVHPSLSFYANMFYTYAPPPNKQRWVKDVPLNNVEKFLTPRALAYFYMDDGALKWPGKSNAMRICTESFSEEGVTRIKNAIKTCYGIETSLSQKKVKGVLVGHRLAIPEASSGAFRELIRPYLVNCMKYKVSDGNYGHL